MSEYNRSHLDGYKHLNSICEFGEKLDDMEMLADLVIERNYGLHRLLSAVYRKSYSCGKCLDNDKARELILELISLL